MSRFSFDFIMNMWYDVGRDHQSQASFLSLVIYWLSDWPAIESHIGKPIPYFLLVMSNGNRLSSKRLVYSDSDMLGLVVRHPVCEN